MLKINTYEYKLRSKRTKYNKSILFFFWGNGSRLASAFLGHVEHDYWLLVHKQILFNQNDSKTTKIIFLLYLLSYWYHICTIIEQSSGIDLSGFVRVLLTLEFNFEKFIDWVFFLYISLSKKSQEDKLYISGPWDNDLSI